MADREQEVADLNANIAETLDLLDQILAQTLAVDDSISFNSLRIQETPPDFTVPETLRPIAQGPTEASFIAAVDEPRGIWRAVPGAKRKHEISLQSARSAHQNAVAAWKRENAMRRMQVMERKHRYDELVRTFEAKRATKCRS